MTFNTQTSNHPFKFPMQLTRIATAVALFVGMSAALAQTVPNTGDALRQAQPPVLPAAPAAALPQVGGSTIEAPMTALPGGPKVDVKSIEVIGNRVIDTATLAALVADGAGKTLSLPELEALAQRITRYYRANGYFVARAYIPAQEVSSGAIKIRVVEGNYGKFILKNDSLVRNDIVQAMLDDVLAQDIVSLETLERVMLIINDTPGVKVTRADVMPGDKVGTSDFAVDTQATAARNGYVLLDNYGSAYTGKNRLSFNADFNSPTGRGDRLSISGLATDTGGLFNGRVGYSALLRANGLRGEVALSRTQYALGSIYSNLDAKGTADALDATLTYPIRRIRAQTIEASLNASHKTLEDKIQSTNTVTPKKSSTVTAGISLRDERRLLGADGLTQASLTLTAGHLQINESAAAANDAAGANTAGSFGKITASISRISLLPKAFTLTTSLKLQQSLNSKNLDGSERMAVSGSNGVMGNPSGELIGSNAALIRLELSRPLPAVGDLQSRWSLFTNWGQAEAAKAVSPTDKRRSISDVGIGWSAEYKGAIIRTHLAHRLNSDGPVSEPYPRNKLLVQAGWVF